MIKHAKNRAGVNSYPYDCGREWVRQRRPVSAERAAREHFHNAMDRADFLRGVDDERKELGEAAQ